MRPTLRGMASVPLELTGGTGRRYRFTKLFQERPELGNVWRLVSYFGDREGLDGLMRHVGDEEVNLQVLELLWEDRQAGYHSYRRFETWEEVRDEGLREVVLGMLRLDPGRRWTAEQVVGHPWFEGSI